MTTKTEATTSLSHGKKRPQPHILIIGAGIAGLVLGQALKKHGIPFTIFERDLNVSARGRGWGLTIHWGLQTFLSLLPQHLVDRLPEVYVDPEASKRGENGNFLFFDLRSGEARWKVPPAQRIRVSRERLRALLLDGLDVQWSKTLSTLTHPNPSSVIAHFSDSTTATGTLLIGADGTHSHTRALLLSEPKLASNHPLPVRMLGASVIYPRPLAEKLRALDPFFFQGGDPGSNTFMYYSFLDTPSSNTRPEQQDTYECQIILSWPFKEGFKGQEKPLEVPAEGPKRVALMKSLVEGWAEPFRESVMSIPEDTDVKTIRLEDWVPRKGVWDHKQGTVTLAGDAAHAMTMYRGEAANHGIADVAVLLSKILPVVSPSSTGPSEQNGAMAMSMAEAIEAYEEEMIERAGPAVLTSRRACLDAHDYDRINDQSPLVSKRVKITKE